MSKKELKSFGNKRKERRTTQTWERRYKKNHQKGFSDFLAGVARRDITGGKRTVGKRAAGGKVHAKKGRVYPWQQQIQALAKLGWDL